MEDASVPMTSMMSDTGSAASPEIVASVAAPSRRSCLNCDGEVTGAYCGACGQRAATGRISFPRLLRSFVDHVLTIDSHLLRTFRELVRRPGPFVRAFLLGRRVGYARPLPYYLLVVALNVGAAAVLRDPADAAAGTETSFWEQNFVALQIGLVFGLLMVPLAAARRLLHLDEGYSVAEHFVFLLYVLAQSILVVLVTDVALQVAGMPFDSNVEGLTWLTAFCGYVVWGSGGFLVEARWKVALKLVASLVLALFGVAAVAGVVQLFS